MTLDSLLHRLDIERRTIAPFGFSIELFPHVTRIRSADGSCHVIFYSALSADNADAVIDSEIDHYRSLQVEVEWKLYSHDQPSDLRERLAARICDRAIGDGARFEFGVQRRLD